MAKRTNGRKQTLHSGGFHDIILHNRMETIANALTRRKDFNPAKHDERRDIDDECGYPKADAIDISMYHHLYNREAVAARVVEVFPMETWKVQPEVYETEDGGEETAFELAWKELNKKLRGGSWFQDEEGGPIWEILARGDILSGIGHYGVLLLGINEGEKLEEPLELSEEGSTNTRELQYVRAYPEGLVTIVETDADPNSPRYTLPTAYNVATATSGFNVQHSDIASSSVKVHWTRVVHLADNLGSSDVLGIPRMRPVYNRLWDIRKVLSASAEMYWQGAFPGLFFSTHPQLGGDVDIDSSDMQDVMEKMMTGLQRWGVLRGMDANAIAPVVSDPSPQMERQIEAICIKLGIPKRIFMGSERGELSSGQDKDTWNSRLIHRQNSYVTPRIIVPFIDRLIMLGVLPAPQEGYSVKWPELDTLSALDESTMAVQKTEALAKYVQGGVESLVPPVEYLTRVLGMDEEEAEQMVEAAMETMEEKDAEEQVLEDQRSQEAHERTLEIVEAKGNGSTPPGMNNG